MQLDEHAPEVACDPGPQRFVTPEQARRFAAAILAALDRLDGREEAGASRDRLADQVDIVPT